MINKINNKATITPTTIPAITPAPIPPANTKKYQKTYSSKLLLVSCRIIKSSKMEKRTNLVYYKNIREVEYTSVNRYQMNKRYNLNNNKNNLDLKAGNAPLGSAKHTITGTKTSTISSVLKYGLR